MTTIAFDSAYAGQKCFFPGTGMVGEVIGIYGRRHRQQIRILFPSGEVTYGVKTWYAVSEDEASKFKGKKGGGPQVVGLTKVEGNMVPPGGADPQIVPRMSKWLRPGHTRSQMTIPDIKASDIDKRPPPEIPGPPVAKPKAGVWSVVHWNI